MLRNRLQPALCRQRRQLHSSAVCSEGQNIFPTITRVVESYNTDEIFSLKGEPMPAGKLREGRNSMPRGFKSRQPMNKSGQRPRKPRDGEKARSGDDRRFGRARRPHDFGGEEEVEKEFVYDSSPYTPEKVSVETLASLAPAVPTTSLGQSSCLQRELAGFTQKSSSWSLKDWQKYGEKRERYAKAVLDGKHPEVKPQAYKSVAEDVKRMALLNGTYGKSGMRTLVEAVKQRLPDAQLPEPQEMKRIET